jgi:hypothetical protein
MKIDNVKQEVTHDMENLNKKNEIEIQNTKESHSSRLDQAEERISDMKMKWKFKEKLKSSRPVKEYARCHRLYQKTKPENHGH